MDKEYAHPTAIQQQPNVENSAPELPKETVSKDTQKLIIGLADGAIELEEHELLKGYVDCFVFSLHDLGVFKGKKYVSN